MGWLRRFGSLALLAATIIASCHSTGSECRAAGGTCILGGDPCIKGAPSSAQDCIPDNTAPPGGGSCCLVLYDGSQCAAAGGRCISQDTDCTNPAATGAQDCDEPGANTCCLPVDGGTSSTDAADQ